MLFQPAECRDYRHASVAWILFLNKALPSPSHSHLQHYFNDRLLMLHGGCLIPRGRWERPAFSGVGQCPALGYCARAEILRLVFPRRWRHTCCKGTKRQSPLESSPHIYKLTPPTSQAEAGLTWSLVRVLGHGKSHRAGDIPQGAK